MESCLSTRHDLNFFNCDITNLKDYRERIFQLLQVTYLDGFDQEDNKAPNLKDEDDEEGDEEDEDEACPPGEYKEVEDEDDGGSDLGEGEEEEEVGLSYLMTDEIQDAHKCLGRFGLDSHALTIQICRLSAVINVSQDARLIMETSCQLWVVEEQSNNQINGDFNYKWEVLEASGKVIINWPRE
ncbi:hypothetical protein Y1Q_0022938 [Alligator mississippiensis]|uniref:Acidic leucine-rich nuclear phosphoprotein 32 family member n=1 Tax=Alligator mississippiensis TaxID=8496 RepID=A0A151LZI7_ALLMI|nr:hypothetical protein Y1Q_0022938 [Alligator mississippiensis]